MSPLPISRSALDRLGERLAASDQISDDDFTLLQQVLDAYQVALVEAQQRLSAMGFAPTIRVKTTGVLIDKLRREESMKLKGVQDIAGARIVVDGTRAEQDAIARQIAEAFLDGARPPRTKDRRAEPIAGTARCTSSSRSRTSRSRFRYGPVGRTSGHRSSSRLGTSGDAGFDTARNLPTLTGLSSRRVNSADVTSGTGSKR